MGLRRFACWVLVVVLCAACGPKEEAKVERAPRPVSVMELAVTDPGARTRVAGSVEPWKIEQIGFEVSGRVRYVIEPDTDIEGSVMDASGKPISEGTVLATLDPTRYELAVAGVKAEIKKVQRQKDALDIEIDRVIPAQRDAAKAKEELAGIEVKRSESLVKKGAGAQRDLDRARASLRASTAELTGIDASQAAKRAEKASLEAQLDKLGEDLLEAQRDVADCVLRSSFPGQVADVHVTSGGFARLAEPAVTVQLMHPITVKFQVAAETARRMNYRDAIPVHVSLPDGSTQERFFTVYIIDPVADPETRTFTITLIGGNDKTHTAVPDAMKGRPVIRVRNLWKLMQFEASAGRRFTEIKAIGSDASGDFLWKIGNRTLSTFSGETTPALDLAKVRVERGERRVSVLGLWTFCEVKVADGQDVDADEAIFAGELEFPEGVDGKGWNGGKVLFDQRRWMLRPGDLVKVDLAGKPIPPGFWVPTEAILSSADERSVFAVEDSPDGTIARQVEVSVHEQSGVLRRVEGEGLKAGTSIVTAGALFLTDGEQINVAKKTGTRP